MIKSITYVLFTNLLLFVFNCSFGNFYRTHEEQGESLLPPHELIQSNYEHAFIVVLLRTISREIEQRIFADDGSPGYIITRENCKVLESLKGELLVGETIVFHDWLEYSPTWQVERAESLIVFLKRDEKTQNFKTIAEAAVFEYDSELIKIVKSSSAKMRAHDGAKKIDASIQQLKTRQK